MAFSLEIWQRELKYGMAMAHPTIRVNNIYTPHINMSFTIFYVSII